VPTSPWTLLPGAAFGFDSVSQAGQACSAPGTNRIGLDRLIPLHPRTGIGLCLFGPDESGSNLVGCAIESAPWSRPDQVH